MAGVVGAGWWRGNGVAPGLAGRRDGCMPSLPPVIFEDEAMIAFDKPSGLPVVPDRGNPAGGSLMGLVRERWGAGVATVHRIDPEASGLVLCAKTKPALDFLSGQFQSKTVEKVYQALVSGTPGEGKGEAPGGAPADEYAVDFVLKEDEGAPGKMCVVKKHGKAALTLCRVRQRFGTFAQVECRPQTGRTHQVRVHLAASGTPILNDGLYGNDVRLLLSDLKRGYKGRDEERPLIARLALHAAGLTLTHPLSRERVTLAAALPQDFSVALKYLVKFGGGGGAGRRR